MNPLKYCRAIWKNALESTDFNKHDFVGLLQKQLDELKESLAKEDYFHAALELADIIFVADHGLYTIDDHRYNPDRILMYRAMTRHQGKTKQIDAKYDKLLHREESKTECVDVSEKEQDEYYDPRN